MSGRKATIVSLVPFKISEWKPGIYPGFFEIPAAQEDNPAIYHVGESKYHVEIDPDRTITVKCPPGDIARSIVQDYEVSCLSYNPVTNTGPGIFWKDGEYSLGEVMAKFPEDISFSRARQHQWFLDLVKMGDDDWEKTGQHKAISDLQRFAAKKLNLERPWIIVSKEVGVDNIRCVACTTLIPSVAIICPNCKMILNMKKYKELQFASEAK